MKKVNLYNSVKTIPVYQYYQLMETGDLRYLLVLEKKEMLNLPEVKITKEFEENYIKVIESGTNFNLEFSSG